MGGESMPSTLPTPGQALAAGRAHLDPPGRQETVFSSARTWPGPATSHRRAARFAGLPM